MEKLTRYVQILLPAAILALAIGIPAAYGHDTPQWGHLKPSDPLPCELDGTCIELTQYPELCAEAASGMRCSVVLEGDEVNWNENQKQVFVEELLRAARGEATPGPDTGCPAHRPSDQATPPPDCTPPTPRPTPRP